MEGSFRRTNPSVTDNLFQAPWDFDFFQALRLLARVYPRRRTLARFGDPPELEAVRFHANLSLQFPPSAIQSLEPPEDEDASADLTVNFMGLTGPQGTLPLHYTEYLIARRFVRDTTAAAFFDLFNHRLISLFYLAWEKHHFPVRYENAPGSSGVLGRFTEYLFDLIGMGTPGLAGRTGLSDFALLSYAGLIAQRPHSASALGGMLRDFFQAPIEIEQFTGKWCRLESDGLSWLDEAGVHNRLGEGALGGDQVWSLQARFRIRVGPLSWERFTSFLPDKAAFHEVVRLTRYFVNQTLDFEVQVIPLASEVPQCCLSDEGGGSRLGLSSWLKTQELRDSPGDLVLAVGASGPA